MGRKLTTTDNALFGGITAKRDAFLSITDRVPASVLSNFLVCVLFSAIALFFVALRIAARIRGGVRLRVNDYAIIWAMFWALFLAIDSIVTATYGGVGHHISEIVTLAPQVLQPMLKTVLIGQITWALANTGVKISIIDFYITLFGTNRKFRQVSYSLMVAVGVYCLLVILIAFLLCQPLAFNWDTTIPGGHCGNRNSAFLTSGILNLILDVSVIILPLPMLWNLHMATHRKVALTLLFSVGAGICGITIWRTIIITELDAADFFYQDGILSTTTNLEPLLGICVACLPICRPLLVAFGGKIIITGSSAFSRLRNTPNQHGEFLNRSRKVTSGKVIGISAHSADGRKFERLHDTLYPLTDITSITQYEGTRNNILSGSTGEGGNNDGIVVTDTWDVTSEPRSWARIWLAKLELPVERPNLEGLGIWHYEVSSAVSVKKQQ
ncbi:hypothetical protein O1611_g2156 [Lasiodiplodia mahajangana]|uniref:Uncharacterized protein n=1 Tax=Lasiodiplodia mahajangana TaxID=1108764 RepID=A0ACC2JW31_9PEZI|nr:hypothetical protein O1611_g2156 [Lasiodiplodia mahajangana]